MDFASGPGGGVAAPMADARNTGMVVTVDAAATNVLGAARASAAQKSTEGIAVALRLVRWLIMRNPLRCG